MAINLPVLLSPIVSIVVADAVLCSILAVLIAWELLCLAVTGVSLALTVIVVSAGVSVCCRVVCELVSTTSVVPMNSCLVDVVSMVEVKSVALLVNCFGVVLSSERVDRYVVTMSFVVEACLDSVVCETVSGGELESSVILTVFVVVSLGFVMVDVPSVCDVLVSVVISCAVVGTSFEVVIKVVSKLDVVVSNPCVVTCSVVVPGLVRSSVDPPTDAVACVDPSVAFPVVVVTGFVVIIGLVVTSVGELVVSAVIGSVLISVVVSVSDVVVSILTVVEYLSGLVVMAPVVLSVDPPMLVVGDVVSIAAFSVWLVAGVLTVCVVSVLVVIESVVINFSAVGDFVIKVVSKVDVEVFISRVVVCSCKSMVLVVSCSVVIISFVVITVGNFVPTVVSIWDDDVFITCVVGYLMGSVGLESSVVPFGVVISNVVSSVICSVLVELWPVVTTFSVVACVGNFVSIVVCKFDFDVSITSVVGPCSDCVVVGLVRVSVDAFIVVDAKVDSNVDICSV